MSTLLSSLRDAIFNPKVRLSTDFPLTGKKLGKAYVISTILFFVGSVVPVLVLFVALLLLAKFGSDEQIRRVVPLLFSPDGQLKPTAMTSILLTTFVTGFVAELWYLSRVVRATGRTLRHVVGLGIDTLKGRTVFHTAWALIWRVAVVFGLWHCFEIVLAQMLTVPEQPTLTFMKQATGGNLVTWFFMAAVLAPLFEEVIFRGFLFQALRATFHEWKTRGEAPPAPGEKFLDRVTRWLGRRFFSTGGRADFAAIVLSAVLFAVEHGQFQPVTLVLLFLMGVFLAEVFRRTGTLWTGILLHAVNNGFVVVMVALGYA